MAGLLLFCLMVGEGCGREVDAPPSFLTGVAGGSPKRAVPYDLFPSITAQEPQVQNLSTDQLFPRPKLPIVPFYGRAASGVDVWSVE